MKMTAMSEEEIKELVDTWQSYEHRGFPVDIPQLIYTWATAKAEAERLRFDYQEDASNDDKRWTYSFDDWLNSVLARIGWPKAA